MALALYIRDYLKEVQISLYLLRGQLIYFIEDVIY